MESYEVTVNRVITYRVVVVAEDNDTAFEQAIDAIRNAEGEEIDDEFFLVEISD